MRPENTHYTTVILGKRINLPVVDTSTHFRTWKYVARMLLRFSFTLQAPSVFPRLTNLQMARRAMTYSALSVLMLPTFVLAVVSVLSLRPPDAGSTPPIALAAEKIAAEPKPEPPRGGSEGR